MTREPLSPKFFPRFLTHYLEDNHIPEDKIVYQMTFGYKVVIPSWHQNYYAAYCDGIGSSYVYYNPWAVDDEIFLGLKKGYLRDSPKYSPLVLDPYIYTRDILDGWIRVKFGEGEYDSLRARRCFMSTVFRPVRLFSFASDVLAYMEDHNFYPFSLRAEERSSKVIWLN